MATSRSSTVRHWGSTEAERAEPFPCDEMLDEPDHVLFRAVSVAAPAAVVFRWLCQLRVAPYSYDWLDNRGRRSPRQADPALVDLEVGQRFMRLFRLVAFETGRSLTLDSGTKSFGRVVVTYRATDLEHGDLQAGDSRLVAKLVFAAPPGIIGGVMRSVLPAGDLVMMRKQLLTFKRLAERDVHRS